MECSIINALCVCCRMPKSLGLKVSEKMLSLSAEVADQKRQSRMDKVCLMYIVVACDDLYQLSYSALVM